MFCIDGPMREDAESAKKVFYGTNCVVMEIHDVMWTGKIFVWYYINFG